jgi:peroxiredoxin
MNEVLQLNRRQWLSWAAAVSSSTGAWGAPSVARLNAPAPAFSVPDASGRQRSSSEFKNKIVVLEWTSPSCPFAAAQYASSSMPRLQRWARDRGIVWLTILSSHPSREDYLSAAKAEAFNMQRGGVPTALLLDESGTMGHAYGAMTADHMFVIDAKGRLVYAGGIDDSESREPEDVKKAHNHVRAALEDLLAGRAVRTATTEPFGCALAYQG